MSSNSNNAPAPTNTDSRRPTLLGRIMATQSLQEIQAFNVPIPLYGDEVRRKIISTKALYEEFALGAEIAPWPMTEQTLSWFITYCGISIQYSINTITDVLIPCVKRIWMENNHQENVSVEISNALNAALRQVKRSPKMNPGTQGKQPAILSDLEIIIRAIPLGIPTRTEELSLFLTALNTGARSITCEHVLVRDILSLIPNESDPSQHYVRINFTRMKGVVQGNHYITLEGSLTTEAPMDAVYWIERHLQHSFGLSLINRATRASECSYQKTLALEKV